MLDHANYKAPTRRHELDHTDYTDRTDNDFIYLPCLADLEHDVRIDSLDHAGYTASTHQHELNNTDQK